MIRCRREVNKRRSNWEQIPRDQMIDWVWRLKERERQSSPASGFLAGEIGWMLLAFPEIEITGLRVGGRRMSF